jgi:hypothetical protein
MKILPVGAELLRAYGQTDMKKLTVAVRKFCEKKNAQQHGLAHRESVFTRHLSVRPFRPTAERIFIRPVILELSMNRHLSSLSKFCQTQSGARGLW